MPRDAVLGPQRPVPTQFVPLCRASASHGNRVPLWSQETPEVVSRCRPILNRSVTLRTYSEVTSLIARLRPVRRRSLQRPAVRNFVLVITDRSAAAVTGRVPGRRNQSARLGVGP